MPKEKKARALSSGRVAACPYCRPTADNLNESKLDVVKSVGEENSNNWEETKCQICMEAPHNAVLLVCSNSTKGCRPYMCKTSKLQSNCLDQFLKSGASKPMLLCPLCRGPLNEWNDVEPAQRELMNSIPRSCSIETCEFSGTYQELEKHASTQHDPSLESSAADTVRQLSMLSYERYLLDIRAMDSERAFAPMVVQELNSSFVFGNYEVIEQAPNSDIDAFMDIFSSGTPGLTTPLNVVVVEQAPNSRIDAIMEIFSSGTRGLMTPLNIEVVEQAPNSRIDANYGNF